MPLTFLDAARVKVRDKPNVYTTAPNQKAFRVTDNVLMQENVIPPYLTGSDHESIVYTNKPKSQRSRSNSCLHTHNVYSYGGGTEGWSCLATVPTPDWYWLFYQNHHRTCCDLKDTIVGLAKTALGGNFGPAFLGASGQGFMNTAFTSVRPDLTTVSVPNFLLDIDDLTKLYKQWKQHLSLAKNLARAAGYNPNVSKAKNVAGGYLGYNFGWKPTVGDISEMIQVVTGMRKKLAAFESQLGQRFQATRKVPTTSNTVSGTYRVPGGALASYRASVLRQCDAFITWQPQPLAVMGGMDKILRGLLDSLGFELNPRIIWDAIPFSFILDWFFGVGSWLSNFKVDALELPITLVDACLQYKEKLTIEWSTVSDHLTGYVPFPRSGSAAFEGTFFHRMPIEPDYATFSGLGWKLPSLKQLTLGVSLATVLKGSKEIKGFRI